MFNFRYKDYTTVGNTCLKKKKTIKVSFFFLRKTQNQNLKLFANYNFFVLSIFFLYSPDVVAKKFSTTLTLLGSLTLVMPLPI